MKIAGVRPGASTSCTHDSRTKSVGLAVVVVSASLLVCGAVTRGSEPVKVRTSATAMSISALRQATVLVTGSA